jgi:hypothetical protein
MAGIAGIHTVGGIMELLTLGRARSVLARYCGAGKSVADPTIADDINMAIERLMNKPKNLSWTTRSVAFCAPNGQLTLPREFSKIIKCRANGYFTFALSKWYEYLEGGPGLLEDSGGQYLDAIDRGFVYTQYDIPINKPLQLLVISDRQEAPGTRILIRGIDETGREVHSTNVMGEYVPVSNDPGWLTENTFESITFIEKPVTKGYVYLSALDPVTGERFFLSAFHPSETTPCYRRYFAKETPCYTAGQTQCARTTTRIDALVRLAYVPATIDSDILLIQNAGAIGAMLKCLRLELADKLTEALGYEGTAVRLLEEQTLALENQDPMIEMQGDAFGGGGVEAV